MACGRATLKQTPLTCSSPATACTYSGHLRSGVFNYLTTHSAYTGPMCGDYLKH